MTDAIDTAEYRELIRRNAAAFHANFSRGDIDANGDLAAEDISVISNTVHLAGRAAFVKRLKRYNEPFPGLQLRDRLIIVDGTGAAVLYRLQGEHGGRFGDHDATGNLVEALSGEMFEFND